jgi:SAM-dependent methyltransferase
MQRAYSRFATLEDVLSPEFVSINKLLDQLHVRYNLPDHADLNELRYPWSNGMLHQPALYAARLWEYPYALLAAGLEPGMKVADIGCGMTAFTIYLRDNAGCEVTGVDPDVFEAGIKYKAHGVSRKFMEDTGLKFLKGDLDAIPLETDSQDRVFSISVMEHVPPDVRRRGMQEIARVLKPGGRAVLTVDMSMWFGLNRPLDLIWESGLNLFGLLDLKWPTRRFGMFSDEGAKGLPADVYGMTLVKDGGHVETQYRCAEAQVEAVPAYQVPVLIRPPDSSGRRLWRRVGDHLLWKVRKFKQDG